MVKIELSMISQELEEVNGSSIPNRKLRVCFSSSSYDSSDDGDITTVESYKNLDFGTQVPLTDGIRCTDLIDVRPRVTDYTVGEGTRSPFEFFGESFQWWST